MANEDMNTMLIKLKERYRYSFIVLKEMVRTDFKLRYQGSFLGIAWSVLKPLMLFCVMYDEYGIDGYRRQRGHSA